MRAALKKRLRQVDRCMEMLRNTVEARDAHRARIAVKKLRYLAELLEPAFPRASRPLLKSLVKPQDDLGDFHDASRWVERWSPPRSRRGAPRLAASRLAGLATERLNRAQLQVQKDVRRWTRSRVAARIASLLGD
jgi:CHAD domain-containing protein